MPAKDSLFGLEVAARFLGAPSASEIRQKPKVLCRLVEIQDENCALSLIGPPA
jgi:hypothetical protein